MKLQPVDGDVAGDGADNFVRGIFQFNEQRRFTVRICGQSLRNDAYSTLAERLLFGAVYDRESQRVEQITVVDGVTVSINRIVVVVRNRSLQLTGACLQIIIPILITDIKAQLNVRNIGDAHQGELVGTERERFIGFFPCRHIGV